MVTNSIISGSLFICLHRMSVCIYIYTRVSILPTHIHTVTEVLGLGGLLLRFWNSGFRRCFESPDPHVRCFRSTLRLVN